MKFHKYHALGNDYLVLDPKNFDEVPSNEAIRRICHRNLGIGSDGILWGQEEVEVHRLWNLAHMVRLQTLHTPFLHSCILVHSYSYKDNHLFAFGYEWRSPPCLQMQVTTCIIMTEKRFFPGLMNIAILLYNTHIGHILHTCAILRSYNYEVNH